MGGLVYIQHGDFELLRKKSGKPVKYGATLFKDGERVIITGGRSPHKSSSTGFIWVKPKGVADAHEREFYAGVYGLVWSPIKWQKLLAG